VSQHFVSGSCEERFDQTQWLSLQKNSNTADYGGSALLNGRNFAEEYIKSGIQMSLRSLFSALKPFLPNDELIRISNRHKDVDSPSITFPEEHPILLTKTNHLSLLLVHDAHIYTLHDEPQLIQSYLSRQFWIFQVDSLIKSVMKQCARCAPFKEAMAQE